jgi:hypothetical protein
VLWHISVSSERGSQKDAKIAKEDIRVRSFAIFAAFCSRRRPKFSWPENSSVQMRLEPVSPWEATLWMTDRAMQ